MFFVGFFWSGWEKIGIYVDLLVYKKKKIEEQRPKC